MKKVKLLLFAIPVIFIACSDDEDGVKKNGPVVTIERSLSEFEGLNMKGVGDVDVFNSTEDKIEITTHENVLEGISTDVLEGELVISMDGEFEEIDELSFSVYTTNQLSDIILEGVGNISYPGPVDKDNLEIILDGVGNINVSGITAQLVTARLLDVGNISLAGTSTTVDYSLRGVGDISAFDLIAEDGEALLSGVGNIQIYCTSTLNVSHSGVGQIQYKGNPTITGETDDIVNSN